MFDNETMRVGMRCTCARSNLWGWDCPTLNTCGKTREKCSAQLQHAFPTFKTYEHAASVCKIEISMQDRCTTSRPNNPTSTYPTWHLIHKLSASHNIKVAVWCILVLISHRISLHFERHNIRCILVSRIQLC